MTQIGILDPDLIFQTSKNQLKPLNIFWTGFILYTLGYAISTTGHVNISLCQLVEAVGLVLVIPTGIYLSKFKIESKYLATIFVIYAIWLLTVIGRGINFDYNSIKQMLFNADYGVFLYLAPFVLLFPSNHEFYKKLFTVIEIFAILSLIYDVVFIRDLLDRTSSTQDYIEHSVKSFGMPCAFLLLTYKYHSNKRKAIALAVMIISLLFAIYKARRGLSSIISTFLLFAYLIYLINTNKKIIIIYLSILIFVAGLFQISRTYEINQKGLFGLIANRGEEDTRTGVELYFYDDMKPKDWAIGKGINGEYFCPDIEENQLTNYRTLIETGYLQIILNGGIIKLILYLLIAIPAIILGIFYSRNILSKASGVWIFVALISLYPTTVESFSLHYLLVWFSIAICYSKKIRNLSDEMIKELVS